jgi:hypothetical protein
MRAAPLRERKLTGRNLVLVQVGHLVTLSLEVQVLAPPGRRACQEGMACVAAAQQLTVNRWASGLEERLPGEANANERLARRARLKPCGAVYPAVTRSILAHGRWLIM